MSTAATTAFYTVLNGYTALQALLTNGDSPATYRVYNFVLPQGVSYPALSFQHVGDVPQSLMNPVSGDGLENIRFRVSCWATTLIQAQTLAGHVRAAMKAATTLKAVKLFEIEENEYNQDVYRVIIDFSVWFRN